MGKGVERVESCCAKVSAIDSDSQTSSCRSLYAWANVRANVRSNVRLHRIAVLLRRRNDKAAQLLVRLRHHRIRWPV
jgi:hypothetical protein